MADDVDVKALVAEARDEADHPRWGNSTAALLHRLADALETVSARPLVADREAVARLLDPEAWAEPLVPETYREAARHASLARADALFASGVVQSKGDAQAEALEEAAHRAEIELPASTPAEVGAWLRDGAAAYRTPASPNSGDDVGASR